jgi:hypothetical protein
MITACHLTKRNMDVKLHREYKQLHKARRARSSDVSQWRPQKYYETYHENRILFLRHIILLIIKRYYNRLWGRRKFSNVFKKLATCLWVSSSKILNLVTSHFWEVSFIQYPTMYTWGSHIGCTFQMFLLKCTGISVSTMHATCILAMSIKLCNYL